MKVWKCLVLLFLTRTKLAKCFKISTKMSHLWHVSTLKMSHSKMSQFWNTTLIECLNFKKCLILKMSYFWKWNASFIKCLTIKMSHFWNVSFLKYLFFTVDCDAMYHWFLICWILLPWIWIKERIETDFLYHAYLRQLVAQVSLSSAYHYEYPIALRHAGNSYWEVLILFQNHFSAFLELSLQ